MEDEFKDLGKIAMITPLLHGMVKYRNPSGTLKSFVSLSADAAMLFPRPHDLVPVCCCWNCVDDKSPCIHRYLGRRLGIMKLYEGGLAVTAGIYPRLITGRNPLLQ